MYFQGFDIPKRKFWFDKRYGKSWVRKNIIGEIRKHKIVMNPVKA